MNTAQKELQALFEAFGQQLEKNQYDELTIAVKDFSYIDKFVPTIILQSKEEEEEVASKAYVLMLDSLRRHPFISNMYEITSKLSMGRAKEIASDKIKLYIPETDDGHLDLPNAFVEYYGLPLPAKLKSVFDKIFDDSKSAHEIQNISLATFLCTNFDTIYKQMISELQSGYAGADILARNLKQSNSPKLPRLTKELQRAQTMEAEAISSITDAMQFNIEKAQQSYLTDSLPASQEPPHPEQHPHLAQE